jgi:5-deoxy-glucuronate isomerase
MSQMFGYPLFDDRGMKVIVRSDSDMMMNISVYKLKKTQELSFLFEDEESAFLLIRGLMKFEWDNRSRIAQRDNFMKDGAWCLHVSRKINVKLTALDECEILVQSTKNETPFDFRLYTPENCKEEVFGNDQFEGKARRTVRTFFDYNSAPDSNMVMGEIITPQGGWSSYPPHHHPQPEVYYYRFEKPQGFGACFIGDDVFKIRDGSFCAIPGGRTHPQVNAPGYPMYYVWMIRHFDGAPWKDRIFAPEHTWLLGT